MPIINRHSLMVDWPKKGNLFLCLSFVPYDIPSRESGGENFIPPLMQNGFLESLLLGNPLPPLLRWKRAKWSNLMPSPTSRVKEQLIDFSKEQIELGFVAASCEVVHHDTCHPTCEGCWWCCILSVWFHLYQGEPTINLRNVLMNSMLNWTWPGLNSLR